MTATKNHDDIEDIAAESMEVLGEVPTDPLIGMTVAERYRIDQKLGEGGMGAVYKGEHILMQKFVAIKVLHREMTAMGEVVQRFEREAIAAGRIDHPNVATATDFGKLPDGAFFLVLEYAPGKPLTDVIEGEGGPLDETRALLIARQVASALGAAHGAGIVHRDLKPDNIMLIRKAGTDDFVKVLDFGIAKVDAPGAKQLTRIGTVFGTPQYMSPEQAQGKAVDRRADLYALGLILYEMLAGHPTFDSEELVGLLTAQMTETPAPLPPNVGREVAALVMKLLEKDPDARHQDAGEVVDALDALLAARGTLPGNAGMPSSVRGAMRSEVSSSLPREATAPARSIDRLRQTFEVGARTAMPVLKHPVSLRGRKVPLWTIVVGAAAVGMLGALVFSGNGASADEPASDAAPSELSPEDDPASTDRFLAMVELGKADAMSKLLEIPEADRSADQWRALARGHEKLRQFDEAIGAYRAAIKLDPKLRADRHMLRFVRSAADHDGARDAALAFAADDLDTAGADLLFHVWSSTSARTPATIAAKEFLDTSKVRKQMSPALTVALELRDARSCADFKKLLGRVQKDGDERSLRPLQKLNQKSGCGFLKMEDCYSCVRGDNALTEAIRAVQIKNAPSF
jgi:eukaryotic-like serine/threonine-protein kinase